MLSSKQDKEQWIESHARQFSRLFRQWQGQFEIDNKDYERSLRRELVDSHDDPLRKSLIESIVDGKRCCVPNL